MSWLPDAWLKSLLAESEGLSSTVIGLADPAAAHRLAALDTVLAHLLSGDRVLPDAKCALPYVLTLATTRRYPQAAALLTRVSHVCAAAQSPPRSGAPPSEHAAAALDAVREALPRLLDRARGGGPAVSRIASTLVARFPERDAELTPALLAQLSGVADAEERAPLCYALSRIQLDARVPLHRRLAEALRRTPVDPEAVAVALALLDAGVPPHEARRLHAIVRAAPRMGDPRCYGRRWVADPSEDPPAPD
ncbi:MAG: hypothetical protein AB8I08_08840 [Sandaracinaceae bacterium]